MVSTYLGRRVAILIGAIQPHAICAQWLVGWSTMFRGKGGHLMRKYSLIVAVAAAISLALMGVDLWMWQRERFLLAIEGTAPVPSIHETPTLAATNSEEPAFKGFEAQWDSKLTLPSTNVSLAR
ncbi:MAG: hypothetical protein H7337_14060 [Rhizobacter sp.]|nr:hypothetical protein [Rhizobacter sp.]